MMESAQHGTGELTKLLGRMFHSHDFTTANLKMMPQFSHLAPAELDQTASRMSEFVRIGEYTLEVDHQFSLASSVSMANEVAAMLMQRTWPLIQAPDRNAFITTDAPAVLTAATPSSQMRGVGFASADASRYVCLGMAAVSGLCAFRVTSEPHILHQRTPSWRMWQVNGT